MLDPIEFVRASGEAPDWNDLRDGDGEYPLLESRLAKLWLLSDVGGLLTWSEFARTMLELANSRSRWRFCCCLDGRW